MKPSVNQANTDGFLSFADASLSPVLFAPAPSLATQTHKLHLLNLLLACCGHGCAYSCPTAHRQLISEFHSRDRESRSILQTILKTTNWITIKWTHLLLKCPLSFKIGSYKKCWSSGLRPMCRKEFLITQSFLWKTFWLNNKLCILPIFLCLPSLSTFGARLFLMTHVTVQNYTSRHIC